MPQPLSIVPINHHAYLLLQLLGLSACLNKFDYLVISVIWRDTVSNHFLSLPSETAYINPSSVWMYLCLAQSTVFLNSGRIHSYGPCEMEEFQHCLTPMFLDVLVTIPLIQCILMFYNIKMQVKSNLFWLISSFLYGFISTVFTFLVLMKYSICYYRPFQIMELSFFMCLMSY